MYQTIHAVPSMVYFLVGFGGTELMGIPPEIGLFQPSLSGNTSTGENELHH